MAKLLKWDWKSVGIVKEIMTNLIDHLQPVMMAIKKNPNNRLTTLLAINKYWRQAFYNWSYNIDKPLNSNKLFYCLEIIVWQYKHIQILVALWASNNITSYRLLKACCGVLSSSYYYQITNSFKKVIE